MIQRIPTIYLLLAALFMGGLFLQSADLGEIDTTATTALSELQYYDDQILDIYDQGLLATFAIVAILFSLVAIFLYRKRKLQILLSRVAVLVVFLFLLMAIYVSYADLSTLTVNINFVPKYGLFLPFISILFLFLAIKNIKKDERLVKSMDRLR